MSDNVAITPGAGATVAADEIASVKYQRIKIVQGADGVNDGDTSSANPLPVVQTGTPGLPTGAATSTKQDTGNTSLTSIDGKIIAVDTGAVVLAAGTATVGKLAANSGVDIGDVDVTSSALPAGASTSALQGTGNTSVGNLDTSTGATTDAAVAAGAAGSVQAKLRRLTTDLDALNTKIPASPATAANQQTNALTDTQLRATAVPVSLATVPSHAVTNAGTFPVQAATAGDVAHDAVNSGNPNQLGFEAIAHGTNPTAVAVADRTRWYANRHGIPFIVGGHPNVVTFEAAYTAAQTDAAIVTVAGGLKIVVTQIQATIDGATTVAVGLRVGFGTATTPTTTGVVLTHPGMVPGGGITRGDGGGIVGVGADNEDLRITSTVPTTGSLRILVNYYTIES